MKQSFAAKFNLRAEPCASNDSTADRSSMAQIRQWLEGPDWRIPGRHVQSFMQYPQQQQGAIVDSSRTMYKMQ